MSPVTYSLLTLGIYALKQVIMKCKISFAIIFTCDVLFSLKTQSVFSTFQSALAHEAKRLFQTIYDQSILEI